MTPERKTDHAKDATARSAPVGKPERKPWVKKSPVDVVLAQIERVKEDVAKREEELKLARRQLQPSSFR